MYIYLQKGFNTGIEGTVVTGRQKRILRSKYLQKEKFGLYRSDPNMIKSDT